MLFDLAKDEAEVHNIAAQHPKEHKRLFGEMMEYLESVGARMPKKNPDFDEAAYKASENYEKIKAYGPFAGSRPLAEDETVSGRE